jgi:diguanylate cyclase (GGDEF)-like protein
VLEAEMGRSHRGGHRLSCCFIDLDRFKDVNDRDGHLEGNRVLSAVGRALRERARQYDSVGRFGGDEFIVVLPETCSRDAGAAAARFRDGALAALAEATEVDVGISIGIAEWDGKATASELLGVADRALANAKRPGGGKIVGDRAEERLDGLLELTKDLIARERDSPGAREGTG